MKTAVRFSIAAVVLLLLAGCAGRQYEASTPPELTMARSLNGLAHTANAIAKEMVVLKRLGKLTPEEAQAIGAWCRQVDVAVPHAFKVLKSIAPEDRAAAVATALAEVSGAGPLQEFIANRGAEAEVQAAVALVRTVLVIVGELVPEVARGK